MSAPRVSIVLPVKNGAATLPALLDAVRRQRTDADTEIVAVDSGSTDGSLDLLQAGADRLVRIDPGAFNHGTTRNLGIESSRGELVVLLVQDAVPASDRWLEALTAPLRRDPSVAGAFARQVPREDASGIARHYLRLWAASGETPLVAALAGAAELEAMAPRERLARCAFDNVCSCVRRPVWARHPFPRTSIGEDVAWAREVLLAGHRIAFAPDACVIHSHDRPLAYEFARTRALHCRLYELFELRTIPTLPLLARAVAVSVVTNLRCERWRPLSLPRAMGLGIVWPLAQYLGPPTSTPRGAAAPERVDPCES
jgi:rhamnosyltransferase